MDYAAKAKAQAEVAEKPELTLFSFVRVINYPFSSGHGQVRAVIHRYHNEPQYMIRMADSDDSLVVCGADLLELA